MDIADWLRSLGLERYEATFRENDVTAGLLPSLTTDDLKDLGITSVGHRRSLLDAIGAPRLQGRLRSAPRSASEGGRERFGLYSNTGEGPAHPGADHGQPAARRGLRRRLLEPQCLQNGCCATPVSKV